MRKFILGLFAFSSVVFAHGIHLHIEKEDNDNLHIHSSYANDKPCVECRLVVLKGDSILLETKLDKKGSFDYKIKENGKLTFKVNDKYGHLVKKDYKTE